MENPGDQTSSSPSSSSITTSILTNMDSQAVQAEVTHHQENLTHPWPHLETFFGPVIKKGLVIQRGRANYKGRIACKNCKAQLMFNTYSLYTLKSHYQSVHPTLLNDLIDAINAGSRRGRRSSFSSYSDSKELKRLQLASIESAFAESYTSTFNNNMAQELFCSKIMEIPGDQPPSSPSPSPSLSLSLSSTSTTTNMDNQAVKAEVTHHQENLTHPWPHLETFFGPVIKKELVIQRGRAIYKGRIACKNCKAKLMFNTYSLYTLKSHYQHLHPNMLNDLIAAINAGSRRGRHTSSNPSDSKRLRLASIESAFAESYAATFNNNKADELFYRYMVGDMLPSKTAESPFLAALLKFLNPHFKIPSRRTCMRTLKKKAEVWKAELTAILDSVRYVATTADCWTAHNRCFLGMVVHWIDPSNLDRKKAILTCQELPVAHSYDVLANTMQDVHKKFHIETKVTNTTTDNGSNFIKDFKIFTDTSDSEDPTCAYDQEDSDQDHPGHPSDIEEDEDDTDEVQPVDLDQLLQTAHKESTWCLPDHHRCASHTLNLLASIDVEKVPNWSTGTCPCFSKVKAKAQALWHKQNQKPTIAASIKREVGRKLRTPNVTRWTCLYDSMEVLSEVLDMKLAQINIICMENCIASFNQTDKDIITEYLTVMKPVVACLDKLHSEKEAYMGVLLPTLYVLLIKLEAMKTKQLKYAQPLLEYLLENPLNEQNRPKGFKGRFSFLFDNMELLMATAIHPIFKMPVVRLLNPEKVDTVKWRLLNEVKKQAVVVNAETSSSEENEAEDFFKVLRAAGPTATDRLSSKIGKEFDYWCSEKEKSSKPLEQAMFPALSRATWVDIFLRYNTAIPSSAAVERLFSQGSDIMKPKRAKLTSENFERLVFLKGNMDLLNMDLLPEDSDCDMSESE